MDAFHTTAILLARQAANSTDATDSTPVVGTPGNCDDGNNYNGYLGLRISAIFVIMVGSFLGAWFPTFARRHQRVGMPEWAFFIAKYFGSGVIIATAFIHLLAPASDALTNRCLTGIWTQYDWAEGIALMAIFVLFFLELMTMRFANFGPPDSPDDPIYDKDADADVEPQLLKDAVAARRASATSTSPSAAADLKADYASASTRPLDPTAAASSSAHTHPHPTTDSRPGHDHLGHARTHTDNASVASDWSTHDHAGTAPETYAAQMTAIFILEFGVIFHSVFIGLTLAVAGAEFKTLYIVLVFHQTFEGLGLGARLASVPWPRSKRWTPYILAAAYGITTPLAIAVGLGIRQSYPPGSARTLVTNGIFDSISAGILIYTGLVELMAHEFMFSADMRKAPLKTVLLAFGLVCLGAGLMALLGKWA